MRQRLLLLRRVGAHMGGDLDMLGPVVFIADIEGIERRRDHEIAFGGELRGHALQEGFDAGNRLDQDQCRPGRRGFGLDGIGAGGAVRRAHRNPFARAYPKPAYRIPTHRIPSRAAL